MSVHVARGVHVARVLKIGRQAHLHKNHMAKFFRTILHPITQAFIVLLLRVSRFFHSHQIKRCNLPITRKLFIRTECVHHRMVKMRRQLCFNTSYALGNYAAMFSPPPFWSYNESFIHIMYIHYVTEKLRSKYYISKPAVLCYCVI